ncbi:MAG: type VI secretion system contractile sheath large subunit [Pseudomonadales bacterium]|nr:type VI secretion system contractile sheath large subunit [Pseudomonadales bacterium]
MTSSDTSSTPILDDLIENNAVAEKTRFETDIDLFLKTEDERSALKLWLERLTAIEDLSRLDGLTEGLALDIAALDELINEQLKVILHHPKLNKLEASWRGLELLIKACEESKKIKIKVLDITWREITRDIERALEFDQSQLFNKVYSEEFGTPGGEPYGVLIADYEVQHRPTQAHPYDDTQTLHTLSQIAAAAFAPLILGTSPSFFGLENFEKLNVTLNYDQIFQQHEYIKWRAYRDTEDSRFLALVLPRILLREPRRWQNTSYHQLPLDADTDNYLWGNACFAMGAILIREFNSVGWFSHIRGAPRDQLSGGIVTDLPESYFKSDAPNVALRPVTDMIITDQMEKELGELGFIPLCQSYDTPFASFHGNFTTQKPKKMQDPGATINARLSAMLQHLLCASRFAHYIKIMVRDKVGSFFSASDCQTYIHNWLTDYISGNDNLDWDMQSKYPLRDAQVQVFERPDKPGVYSSVIHLKPHYQLDQMVSELKLTTELSALASSK